MCESDDLCEKQDHQSCVRVGVVVVDTPKRVCVNRAQARGAMLVAKIEKEILSKNCVQATGLSALCQLWSCDNVCPC